MLGSMLQKMDRPLACSAARIAVKSNAGRSRRRLATNTAVMAVGGFGGSDPEPSLTQFQADVAAHEIGHCIAPDKPWWSWVR